MMKKKHICLEIVCLYFVILLMAACNNETPAEHREKVTRPDTTEASSEQMPKNDFEKLRIKALATTPEQFQIKAPSDKLMIYGMVMDWEMGGTISTTVSYQNGDASLYLSSGGGVIGNGHYPDVNSAAKLFVSNAKSCIDKARKTTSTPLPEKDQVIFYFLTNQGIYTGSELMKYFENNSSSWQSLFDDGNRVIASLRKSSVDK